MMLSVTCRHSYALSALCKDYNGIAREVFGTLERQRRALGSWISALERDEVDSGDIEPLCVLWDSVITVMLEMTCRHG